MSELLDRAVAQVQTLPQDVQDEVARLLLDWAGEMAPADKSPFYRVLGRDAARSHIRKPLLDGGVSLRA